jgi:NAD(P)-dependent dehydrogenase (short-subunit alcohol dehydrogenase family)
MYTFGAFLPLIRNGKEKKMVQISSPSADLDFIRGAEFSNQLGYAVGKAGGNIVVAKLALDLAKEGIKTLSLSPGWVTTDACECFVQ